MDNQNQNETDSPFKNTMIMAKIKAMTETIDLVLDDHNGIKMKFALVVFSSNQAMMTGNGDREEILEALEHVLKAHREGAEVVAATTEELNEMMEGNEKPKH